MENHTMEVRKVARKSSYLPEDILLHHIFLKLPIEDIAPCKYVCKDWNRVIRNPEFATLHFNKNQHLYRKKLLIQDENSQLYAVGCDQAISSESTVLDASKLNSWATVEAEASSERIRLVGSKNGLVLVQIRTKLILWNPTTKESRMRPDSVPPLRDYHLLGLAYDSTADDFKIVRVCHSLRDYWVVTVDVYSLRNNSWKILKTVKLLKTDYDEHNSSCYNFHKSNPSPVEVNGYTYWMTGDIGGFKYASVFGISLSQEKLNRVSVPDIWHGFACELNKMHWGLAELGKQDLTAYMYWKVTGDFFAYTMKEPDVDNPKPRWNELIERDGRIVIFNASGQNLDPLLTTSIKSLLITDEGKILLLITYGTSLDQKDHLNLKYGLYDPQQDRLQHIPINGLPGSTSFAHITYLESLVSPTYFGRPT